MANKRDKGCPARPKLKQRPKRLDLLVCRRDVKTLQYFTLLSVVTIIARLSPIFNFAQKRQHGKET